MIDYYYERRPGLNSHSRVCIVYYYENVADDDSSPVEREIIVYTSLEYQVGDMALDDAREWMEKNNVNAARIG